jgi:hypothetical protein
MRLLYIDDSYRHGFYCFSAISIPAEHWKNSFEAVKIWRRELKERHGLFIRKELHAVDLCAGRGRISEIPISKWDRCNIFRAGLRLVASFEGVQVFNVCSAHSNEQAFERLLNRINRTLQAWDSHAILICDEGDEPGFTRLVRKMHAFNPIPSRYGGWGEGKATRHIPIDRILEDPIFKDSKKSMFVQLADFCAYALLQKESPNEARMKYGIHTAYEAVRPVYMTATNPRDADGIIR